MTRNAHDIIPQDAEPGTADATALITELEIGVSRHCGRPRRVERLERRRSPYSTSFPIDELDVSLDSGELLPLVLKDLSWDSLIGDASSVRPHFLHNPRREIDVYQKLLAGRSLGTAACFGVTPIEQPARHWLLLERIHAAKLCHVGELAIWEKAAKWLATFHAKFLSDAASLAQSAPLLAYNQAFYALWPARAEAFLKQNASTDSSARSNLIRIIRTYAKESQRMTEPAPTLIHGDFYASNILVRTNLTHDGGPGHACNRICPIDWELAAIGPPLIDLAALTAGNWSDAERNVMVEAYRRSLADAGIIPLPRHEMLENLDWCRLHLAFQWLGWAADWNAPPDQAQNWLAEALLIASRLGL